MDLGEITKAYQTLPPPEQALFAAIVRAHQLFNSANWQTELARRHEGMDDGRQVATDDVQAFLSQLDAAVR